MSVSPLTMNSAELGRLIGLTERQVRRLHRDGVFPRVGTGRHDGFDPFVCVPKFVEYVRQGTEKTEGIAQSRQGLIEAQRRDLELKTSERRRELLPFDEVAAAFEAAMTLIGGQLDAIGGRLCSELAAISDPATIRERVFSECRRVRNAAAGELEAFARAPARRKGARGAPAANA
jgi:hypothetical protein